jgi:CubicO group peptidase (beta-lactamase class C family)
MKTLSKLFFFCLLIGDVSGQNVEKESLANLIKTAEERHSDAILIYQDNKLITENYFRKTKSNTKIEAMSATKSIVGLAVACMLSDGILESLDTPVCKYYPEWKQGQKKLITVRHLVNMTSGLQNVANTQVEIYPSKNFVQLGLCAELSSKPGEKFEYNNKALNLMAGVFMQVTGQRMDKYIGERLFKKLEITDFSWTLDPSGNPHVMSGCQIKPSDFIKLGLLVANKGLYLGQQVITEKSIFEVLEPSKQNKTYGVLWWLDYERTISTVDEEKITEFKNANLNPEFIGKAILMKGIYYSDEEYLKKRELVFGTTAQEYITKNLNGLSFRKRDFAGDVTYRAEGFLGNYIIINPKTKMVAIRMISERSHQIKGKDDFIEFKDLVNKL